MLRERVLLAVLVLIVVGRSLWMVAGQNERGGPVFRCPYPIGVQSSGRGLVVHCFEGRVTPAVVARRVAPHCRWPDTVLVTGALLRRVGTCGVVVARLGARLRLLLGLTIDINRASAKELEALPRIGPKLAARIVAWRRRHGPFARLRQLRRVKGIGRKTVERLRPSVSVRSAR